MTRKETSKTVFNIWGYKWKCCMEGGRLIHPDKPYVFYDQDQISYEDGIAYLTLGEVGIHPIEYWDGRIFYPVYGGGLLRSLDTFGFGIFSADICLPEGKGLWPSFWLCGEGTWPEHGEIDIEEGYSDHNYLRIFTPYFPWLNPSWTTTNNVHYSFNGQHMQIGSRGVSIFKQPYNPDKNFIQYRCEWTPVNITISVDGRVVRRDTKAVKMFSAPSSRMCVIFNLLCENPQDHKIAMQTPMIIKNFKYQPL